MSDPKGLANHGGAGEPSAGEPSMDEILASIRRILKEDENQDETFFSDEPEDEILILSAEMEANPEDVSAPPEPPAALFASPEPEPAPLGPATPPNAPGNGTEMEQVMDEHGKSMAGLVSETTTAEITSALGPLMRGVTQDRSAAVGRSGVTLEDIVREEIRPVLKAWLDAHLPGLVERIVRAEIARVIDQTKL
jgi:cell pole-organizing protein PopZ